MPDLKSELEKVSDAEKAQRREQNMDAALNSVLRAVEGIGAKINDLSARVDGIEELATRPDKVNGAANPAPKSMPESMRVEGPGHPDEQEDETEPVDPKLDDPEPDVHDESMSVRAIGPKRLGELIIDDRLSKSQIAELNGMIAKEAMRLISLDHEASAVCATLTQTYMLGQMMLPHRKNITEPTNLIRMRMYLEASSRMDDVIQINKLYRKTAPGLIPGSVAAAAFAVFQKVDLRLAINMMSSLATCSGPLMHDANAALPLLRVRLHRFMFDQMQMDREQLNAVRNVMITKKSMTDAEYVQIKSAQKRRVKMGVENWEGLTIYHWLFSTWNKLKGETGKLSFTMDVTELPALRSSAPV